MYINTETAKSGFTLLELLITMAIITMMIIFAIPAFAHYGEEMAFKQEVQQIESLVNQAKVMSQNPEQGSDSYKLVLNNDEKKVILYKGIFDNDSSFVRMNELSLGNKQEFDGTSIKYIQCNVKEICLYGNSSGSQVVLDEQNFTINNKSINKVVKFTISENPFSIKSEISNKK